MNRSRRWSVLIGLVVLTGLHSAKGGQAQPPEKKEGDKPDEKWLFDRSLTISPARAPVPALKYRLYPTIAERKEGNAVPMYLRFAHERSDAQKKALSEKTEEWIALPADKLPLPEMKEFLGGYSYKLRQLELGARRKTADWSYALDSGSPIEILLPDAQEMRKYGALLVVKARVEIAEGHYADALHTLETAFSFSQQISEGPFLIHSLVAIAGALRCSDAVLELIERPDSPNLYWALTALPRPLIDLRKNLEFEQQMLELQFPRLEGSGSGAFRGGVECELDPCAQGGRADRPPGPEFRGQAWHRADRPGGQVAGPAGRPQVPDRNRGDSRGQGRGDGAGPGAAPVHLELFSRIPR